MASVPHARSVLRLFALIDESEISVHGSREGTRLDGWGEAEVPFRPSIIWLGDSMEVLR